MEGDPRFKEILSTFDKSPNGYYFEDSFSYFEDCFKDSCYVFMASGFTWMCLTEIIVETVELT